VRRRDVHVQQNHSAHLCNAPIHACRDITAIGGVNVQIRVKVSTPK